MQRLFAALTAFAFIIALLAMESPVIIRRFCGEAVGEEVLPNFKNSKITFRVHKHRFVWLPPLFSSSQRESALHSSVSQAVVWV